MRGARSVAAFVSVVGFLAGCAASNANRRGLARACNSDRDCLYGLVCRGAPVGQPGPRRCVFEQYSRCEKTADCYPGRICRNHACTVQCITNADCLPLTYIRGTSRPDMNEDDFKCVVGECRNSNKDTSCLSRDDCSPGQECVSGQCQDLPTRCTSDAECGPGLHCVKHACE